jgi:hypothetical protein
MSDLRVIVHAGGLPHVDIGLPEPADLKTLDLRRSRLTFAEAGGQPREIPLGGWKARTSEPPSAGFAARWVLIPPERFQERFPSGGQAQLVLEVGGSAPLTASGPIIDRDAEGSNGKGKGNGNGAFDREIVADLRRGGDGAYPILVSPGPDYAGGGGGAPAGGGDARAVVQREWRNVLGRTPRDGDVAGMLAALDRRFVETEADGVDGWTYVPGSYVGQNDVGAGVTGAQASLASFAGRASEEIATYVAEAQPLRQLDDNPEEVDIARAGFWASWQSFVGSLGDEGGLPVARSVVLLSQAREQLVRFGIELGMFQRRTVEAVVGATDPRADTMAEVEVIQRIPITRRFVLTRDDEERLTNFMIVRDRVAAVARAFAETTGPDTAIPDLGMVFTWLQRDLDVLPELVADVRWALDSVDFGPEQQEVTSLDPDDPNAMTLAGVLQWAEDLSDEGRTLLQDAGRRGAAMLAERAQALGDTLSGLDDMIEGTRDGSGVSAARLAMSRISVPIALLGDAVGRVDTRARQVAEDTGADGAGPS